MKRLVWLLLLLLAGCAHNPPIQPVEHALQERLEQRCRSIFPRGKWQLAHTIQARFYHDRQAVMTGVVVLSDKDSTIHCVLMSLEGFVLFEATDNGRLTINRAYGPFDDPAFARGVMRDIRLMFLAPEAVRLTCGGFEGAASGCRFITGDDRTIDVVDTGGGRWRIRQINPPRTVIAEAIDDRGLASRMILEAGGDANYKLTMHLVDAIAIAPEDKP